MTPTDCALRSSAMLSLLLSGCSLLPSERSLPDPNVPHRVAETAVLKVWVRHPDNSLVEETVRIDPGWWVASPQTIDPPPQFPQPTLGTSP